MFEKLPPPQRLAVRVRLRTALRRPVFWVEAVGYRVEGVEFKVWGLVHV